MSNAIRKFFGFTPKVGDKIAAYTDFGVRFEGVVTDDSNAKRKDFPHYKAKGIWRISNMWKGEITRPDDDAIIPTGTAKLL